MAGSEFGAEDDDEGRNAITYTDCAPDWLRSPGGKEGGGEDKCREGGIG